MRRNERIKMICVIQRVKNASVVADGVQAGRCTSDGSGAALLLLLGVVAGDEKANADKLADKISKMRVFEDENGKMNFSVLDKGGQVLAVSNFTLCASCRRGNRPDFFAAEKPDRANELYEYFASAMEARGVHTERGVFGADMQISCQLDGPVTIILDTDELS